MKNLIFKFFLLLCKVYYRFKISKTDWAIGVHLYCSGKDFVQFGLHILCVHLELEYVNSVNIGFTQVKPGDIEQEPNTSREG